LAAAALKRAPCNGTLRCLALLTYSITLSTWHRCASALSQDVNKSDLCLQRIGIEKKAMGYAREERVVAASTCD
jgi:hypothetical protein